MIFFETHTHLTDEAFDADRPDAVARALSVGVGTLIEIAEQESQWEKARVFAEAFPGRVFWTAGLHPYYAADADATFPERLATALKHPACVGVGEIGTDHHRPDAAPAIQRNTLERLIPVAMFAGKPLVIHCRDVKKVRTAQDDLLGVLRSLAPRLPDGGPVGVAHCFQGEIDVALELLSLNFLIGVDGPLTYPNASVLRALIQQVPLDRLVLETDSPYLPPQTHRGGRNETAYLPSVAQALAELKGVTLDEVARATTANAQRLFRIKNNF